MPHVSVSPHVRSKWTAEMLRRGRTVPSILRPYRASKVDGVRRGHLDLNRRKGADSRELNKECEQDETLMVVRKNSSSLPRRGWHFRFPPQLGDPPTGQAGISKYLQCQGLISTNTYSNESPAQKVETRGNLVSNTPGHASLPYSKGPADSGRPPLCATQDRMRRR